MCFHAIVGHSGLAGGMFLAKWWQNRAHEHLQQALCSEPSRTPTCAIAVDAT